MGGHTFSSENTVLVSLVLKQGTTVSEYFMLGMLRKNSADNILKYSYFYYKVGFDISCKLSPKDTICIKCLSLFSGKNKKKISGCYLAQNVVKTGSYGRQTYAE